MAIIETLQTVLDSPLLSGKHLIIPSEGASDEQIALEETKLSRKLSHPHRRLLKNWNGLGLGIFTFFGAGETQQGIDPLSKRQGSLAEATMLDKHRYSLLIGLTPTGQLYGEDEIGHIFSLRQGHTEVAARNLEDFIRNYLFGEGAEQFGGREWKKKLIQEGILDAAFSDCVVRAV